LKKKGEIRRGKEKKSNGVTEEEKRESVSRKETSKV